jgi:hypothetical protein
LVNTRRIQAGLGDLSPDEYEAAWYGANIDQPRDGISRFSCMAVPHMPWFSDRAGSVGNSR